MSNIIRGWNKVVWLQKWYSTNYRVQFAAFYSSRHNSPCAVLDESGDFDSSQIADPCPFHIPIRTQTNLIKERDLSNTASISARDYTHRLLNIIRESTSPVEIWDAYRELLELLPPPRSILTERDFQRVFAFILRHKPRIRADFLRLLEVCNSIHAMGFEMKMWQWNALIDASAKGFRHIREEDYQVAMGVYEDMQRRRSRNSSDEEFSTEQGMVGDIGTYTTLLAIAARTRSSALIRHASRLLEYSQLQPSRVTELAVIPYLTKSGEFHAVKAVIENVHAKGLEVGIDGINSLLWAYASNESFELPLGIYRSLRRHALVDLPARELQKVEPVTAIGNYTIPLDMKPDRATYTLLIQSLAYHGHLVLALEVFRDMLALPEPPPMSRRYRYAESEHLVDAHLIPIYRALFLGFSRHGARQPYSNKSVIRLPEIAAELAHKNKPATLSPWNVHNLQMIFDMFMDCVTEYMPNSRTLFWILKGFARTSHGGLPKMRQVWTLLNNKFGSSLVWKGRMLRVKKELGNDEVVVNHKSAVAEKWRRELSKLE